MKRHVLVAIPLVAAFLQIAAAPSALAQNDQRVPVEQVTTLEKARFVGNLVTRSVATRMIEENGDATGKANLAKARDLVEQARVDLANAKFEHANGKLNRALRLVNTEVRKLSERDVKQKRLQEAYDKRWNSVTIFLAAYERVAGERELSTATAIQVEKIRRFVAEAETLAASGRMGEANEILETAYRVARGDIRNMREGETLVRSLRFETAQDEYQYERNRNDSHVMLLKFALTNKNPTQARRKRIDELEQQAKGLRNQAQREADAGDHPTAIRTLVTSTDTLLKAIRMSGVWIPG